MYVSLSVDFLFSASNNAVNSLVVLAGYIGDASISFAYIISPVLASITIADLPLIFGKSALAAKTEVEKENTKNTDSNKVENLRLKIHLSQFLNFSSRFKYDFSITF